MNINKSRQSLELNNDKEKTINPENKIKKGVDFVFEQNPELTSIGTKEQYSQYLNSIFPNSPYKEIVYHSSDDKFENFDDDMTGKKTDSKLLNHYGKRIHFVTEPSNGYGKFIIAAIINPNKELGEYPADNSFEYPKVEKSDQIHILGSESDINKFKYFVENKKFKID